MIQSKSISGKKYIFFALFLFLFLFSFFALSKSLDPDFGWHLKTGQLILQRGVPKVDWYSYTMPKFPWIDHEWLTDVSIYKIYSIFGQNALLAVFLLVFISAFILLIKKEFYFDFLIPIFLGYMASIPYLGIRPQILTVFFVSLFLLIINKFLKEPNTKVVYFLPILFLIWANLHGGFFVGFLLVLFILILEFFKKTFLFKKLISFRAFSGQNFKEIQGKQIKTLLIVSLASVLFTFMNPYGVSLYREVFRTIGDSFLKHYITEWTPLLSGQSISESFFAILYLGMFTALLVNFYKKINVNSLFISLAALVFGILSQRNFLIFVILTIPVFAQLIYLFKNSISPQTADSISGGFKKWVVILAVFALLIFGFYPYFASNASDTENYNFAPKNALDFLKTLPASENLLNEYSFGGYLIWKAPERKVFIDGRMPSWRENGQFVFGDYVKIMSGQDVFNIIDKYNIKIILLKKDKIVKAQKYIDYQKKLENSNFLKFLEKSEWFLGPLGVNSPPKNIYNELINSDWKIVYEDDTALILKK